MFDLEMIEATSSCAGIENYSRYLTGRQPGEPPPTLFEYLPDDALLFVDESHVTIGQLNGMFRGDYARKRSEEHTSELQSLMRISYDVFCLKKKKNTTQQPTPQNN